jgi:hypothetical protein
VSAICPEIIDTPLFRTSFEDAPEPEAELRRIIDRYLIKRAVSSIEHDNCFARYLTLCLCAGP